MLAYIDTRPFLFAFGLVAAVILILGYRVFRGRWPRIRTVAIAFGVSSAVFFFMFYGPFVGYTRHVTHQMRWQIDPTPHPSIKGAHVILTFRDYPGYHLGIYSDQLADYLKRLPTNEVPVEFEVTYDYGNIRGFNERRIGELTSWQSGFGYYGTQGSPTKSPF